MLYSALVTFGLVAATAASDILLAERLPAHRGIARRGSLKRRCNSGSTSSSRVTASSKLPSTALASTTATASTRTNSTGSTNTNWLKRNCVTWGWIGDDGDHAHGSTGTLLTPATINKNIGIPGKYFGAYGHMQGNTYKKGQPSTYFDGSEVLPFVDYLKGTGASAVLSIMPVYGFGGMTNSDNTQAVQLANVIKQFDEAGISVLLRWGHEMNWYFTPGSDDANSGSAYYLGTASDYITAWKVVHAAVTSAVPSVKMFWSPNIGSASAYAEYWPGKTYVDIVGVDYYPNGDYSSLASHVQDIHDTYAKANNIPFHIGETGTTADSDTKLDWVDVITSQSTCSSLPNLEAIHWFEYLKGGDFRLSTDKTTAANFVKLMETS